MPVSPRIAVERQARHDARMAAAAKVVPHGMYCYGHTGRMVEQKVWGAPEGTVAMVPETKTCPYWTRNGKKPDQRNGYCRLLKAGDWMPHPRGTMLLWDQCKECGINNDLGDEAADEEAERLYAEAEAMNAASVPAAV